MLGQILLTKYLSNYLIRAKGIIVFSSSSSAQTPTPWMSAFGASNAAIDQYALILRSELKPFGVRVHSVVRGNVDTGNFNGVETTTVRGSHYAVDGIYESLKLVESVSSHNQTSPASYANQVLNEVLNPWWGISRFNIYGGTRAYLSHLFARYLPLWILEYSLAYQYGELKVWREIRKARRQRR